MPDKNPQRIQAMFGSIAPVYDFLNHALSLNIDRVWRRFAVRSTLRPGDRRALDVACGTGDLTMALRSAGGQSCQVVGIDFCIPMLRRASDKSRLPFAAADGLRLPFPDDTFDVVTIGFGLRNMASLETGLRELRRVLRPGGRLAVLEFSTPSNPLVRAGYLAYFNHILPFIGNLLSRSGAYRYLNESVLEWPDRRRLARILRKCGFGRVRHCELSLGIAALHIAEKN